MSHIAYEIAARTDPGRDPEKQVNEDAVVHADTPLGVLAVVCDGMGGHSHGQEASALAVKTIVERLSSPRSGVSAPVALREAIEEANARVFGLEESKKAGFRPGATVVALLVHEGGAEVAHVGDSRVYMIHAGAIVQVTTDHSMVQKMVEHKLIRPEEAANHPDANKILRALGLSQNVEVEVRGEPIPFVTGDTFILCSDGLSDLVSASEILDVAASHPPAQAAGQLVDLANARGGHDNITVQIVRLRESARVSPDGAATIVDTMPLTASPPLDAGAGLADPTQPSPAVAPPPAEGSGETLMAAPLAAAPAPPQPTPQLAPVAPAAIPAAPRAPESTRAGRSRAPLFIGIGIAVAGLVAVAALVWSSQRPQHKPVDLVEPELKDAGVTLVDDDNDPSTPPVPRPVPPLSAAPPRPRATGVHVVPPATQVRPDSPPDLPQPTALPSTIPTAPPAPPLPPPTR